MKTTSRHSTGKEFIEAVRNARNVHLVGLSSAEGMGYALFLAKMGIPFTAHDFCEESELFEKMEKTHITIQKKVLKSQYVTIKKYANFKFKNEYLSGIEKSDYIVISQNFDAYPQNAKLVRMRDESPAVFHSITQAYFALFPGKILAITGTNGKSTTSKLIADVMMSSRQKTWFTGNDRRNVQILDKYDEWKKGDCLVIEVSNRQLKMSMPRAPDIGVITNVTQNHLAEYAGAFEKYADGKFSLIRNQNKKNGNCAVLNADNGATREMMKKASGEVYAYSVDMPVQQGVYVDGNRIVYVDKNGIKHVMSRHDIALPGVHNLSNCLATILATRLAGVQWTTIRRSLEKAVLLPQRLEKVHVSRGVTYIDDTASTTPESTGEAVKSFAPGTVRLICGGGMKGMKYEPLMDVVMAYGVKELVLLNSPVGDELLKLAKKVRGGIVMRDDAETAKGSGRNAQERSGVGDTKLIVSVYSDLKTAVQGVKQRSEAGDTVLLSPSGEYFVYFAGKIEGGGKGFGTYAKEK